MTKFKKISKYIVSLVFIIFTCEIVIIGGVNYILGEREISITSIFQMLIAAICTALTSTLLFVAENASKRKAILLIFLHFFATASVIIVFGLFFEWMTSFEDIFIISAIFVTVYALTWGFGYITSLRDTISINERLNQLRDEDNEE